MKDPDSNVTITLRNACKMYARELWLFGDNCLCFYIKKKKKNFVVTSKNEHLKSTDNVRLNVELRKTVGQDRLLYAAWTLF